MTQPKAVVFTCNWSAYSGMEAAGVERLDYPAQVRPIKVMCLGQLSPGIILKALEIITSHLNITETPVKLMDTFGRNN